MASILKVDTLQKPDGSTPTAADLGIAFTPLTSDDMPAGSILQFRSNQDPSHPIAATTSTSMTNTGFKVDITPKQIGSIIHVKFNTNAWRGSSSAGIHLSIYKDSTLITNDYSYGTGKFVYGNTGTDVYTDANVEAWYTTTSLDPISFWLYFRSWSGADVRLNQHSGIATATAYEIAQ